MPKDTNPLVVVGENQTNSSTAPAHETGNTNTTPILITPEVEPPHTPIGSGSSVAIEPDLGTPIVRDEPTPITVSGIQTPTPTDLPNKNPIQNAINNLPSFLGGSAGSGGAGGGGAEDSTEQNTPKKPNYVLYVGILLAVIIAYKVLSKKKK